MPDLSTTNMWLAILAVASLVQVLLLIGAAIAMARVVARANAAAEAVQHQIAPLAARMSASLEDLHDLARRIQRADDEVHAAALRASETLSKATHTLGVAGRMVSHRTWPVLGLVRAAQAVVSTIRTRSSRRSRDRDDEARFAYEGAPVNVRS